jgi:hypothetical protein
VVVVVVVKYLMDPEEMVGAALPSLMQVQQVRLIQAEAEAVGMDMVQVLVVLAVQA